MTRGRYIFERDGLAPSIEGHERRTRGASSGAPVTPTAPMTALTKRQAVVRLQRQSRKAASCGSRCALRSANMRSSSLSTLGGNGTCRTIPRLRRLSVSMLATPLSMSIAAGVSARTSERRAPLNVSALQKRRSRGGSRCADSRNRRRSAPLRYLRIPDRLKRVGPSLAVRASPHPLKQNGRFCFRTGRPNCNGLPCGFFHSAWQVSRCPKSSRKR
jgi:hypothetical protein